jgi:hypothetical protein
MLVGSVGLRVGTVGRLCQLCQHFRRGGRPYYAAAVAFLGAAGRVHGIVESLGAGARCGSRWRAMVPLLVDGFWR